MKQITVTINNTLYIRVDKRVAQSLAEIPNASQILVYPRKVNPLNNWINPYIINDKPLDKKEFYRRVSEFEYYNCNYELGAWASYYIPFSTDRKRGKKWNSKLI